MKKILAVLILSIATNTYASIDTQCKFIEFDVKKGSGHNVTSRHSVKITNDTRYTQKYEIIYANAYQGKEKNNYTFTKKLLPREIFDHFMELNKYQVFDASKGSIIHGYATIFVDGIESKGCNNVGKIYIK